MTEEELMQKFSDIFQGSFPASQIDHYEKLFGSKNTIAIFLHSGSIVFFTYTGKVWKLLGENDYTL